MTSGSIPPVRSASQTLLTARSCGALPALAVTHFIRSACGLGLRVQIPLALSVAETPADEKMFSLVDRLLKHWRSTSFGGCAVARLITAYPQATRARPRASVRR